jgi:tRNA(Ile)-lysidine synthase
MQLPEKVKETIKKYSMLSENDSVLIGLSGGTDSVCLTGILVKFKKDFNLSAINAVYVDHGLRPDEVENEKIFCRNFCDSLGIGFVSKSVDVKNYAKDRKLSKQEAARELRYQVFEEISIKVNATKIALGHTADDQAETFLIRLLRGSGTKGLSGIPPVRSLAYSLQRTAFTVKNNISIIRPLIEIERDEIEKFLAVNSSLVTCHSSLPFVVDSSNLKTDYLRNWIRHKIIPELKKKNPDLIKAIGRASDILRDEDAYLETIVNKTLMRLISRKSSNTVELFIRPLETMEKPILRRILRRVIQETGGLRGMGFIHIEDIISLIKEGRAGDRLYLSKGVRAVKEYSLMIITSEPPIKIAEYELQPPCKVAVSGAGVIIEALFEEENRVPGDGKSSVLLDAGAVNFPLKIRPRADGDFFFPFGFGKKKKLQDFFVDEKVPRDDRDKIPIVLSGNDIVWVAGYRADERFRVTGKTEKFLRLIISRME